MPSQLSVPVAVLVGTLGAGLMTGAGAYLGLRTRGGGPAPLDAETVGKRRVVAMAEAGQFLDSQRPLLAERCHPGGADPTSYLWNFTFAPDGRQVARGLVVKSATSQSERDQCLTLHLPRAQVSPPGAQIYVEVPFAFP